MSGATLMFPGQGSQHVGMGRDLFDRYPELCARADEVVGYSMTELCLEDPHDRLGRTSYTQQAIYFVGCLMYLDRVEHSGGENAVCLLGHSLGLYPALFAAGVFDLVGGLKIVSMRGGLMEQVRGGGMTAVIGPHVAAIEEKLVELEFFDVDVANYNSPDQIVLSGMRPRLEQLAPLLEAAGYRCIPLPVGGPFHSRYMEPARREFARFLLDRELAPPGKTVVSTTSGGALDAAHLLEEMAFQLVRPVRWSQTVANLARSGSHSFAEVGPGTVLTRLNAKILDPEPRARG